MEKIKKLNDVDIYIVDTFGETHKFHKIGATVYLGGSIVTENVFSWPGLGRYMIDAIYSNDYPVVQGAVLIYAAIVVIVNLIVDLTYTALDPRVKI